MEAPRDEVPAVAELLRRAMEGAAEISVPLELEIHAGPNWDDLASLPELALST
jgi:DNA polymerase-1